MPKRLPGRSPKTETIRPSEQLLIDAVSGESVERVFCTSLGRGQFARHFAHRFPDSQVNCLFLDIYLSNRARSFGDMPGNLDILCAADPPPQPFDMVAMPLTQGGEAELSRDLMQSAFEQLEFGGRMTVAVDNPKDTWLHGEMQNLFSRVRRDQAPKGVIYSATKQEPLKKRKDFRAEFKFRDNGRLISVNTRPGVFSHRKLDTGARALMEVMQIESGQRVLDIGAGAGVLSLAARLRAEEVSVTALDSHARAIECTQTNAALNGLDRIAVELNASGQVPEPGTYDVALANPPYYSGYRIAEIFLKAARRALQPGGVAYFVTKSPAWYEKNMPKPFRDIEIIRSRGYNVVKGFRR